jgi:hypothetical protein
MATQLVSPLSNQVTTQGRNKDFNWRVEILLTLRFLEFYLRGCFEKEKTGKFEGIFSKKLLKFEKTKRKKDWGIWL